MEKINLKPYIENRLNFFIVRWDTMTERMVIEHSYHSRETAKRNLDKMKSPLGPDYEMMSAKGLARVYPNYFYFSR